MRRDKADGKKSGGNGVQADAAMSAAPAAADPQESGTVIPSQEPGPHILVVDDDDMIRKGTRGYFELNGLPSIACGTLEEARAIMREDTPRMMILDAELSDGSGIGFCRELRDGGHTFPILIHTAISEAAGMRAGYDAGCTDYIVKPFDVRLLMLKSKMYLEFHEALPRIGLEVNPLGNHPRF